MFMIFLTAVPQQSTFYRFYVQRRTRYTTRYLLKTSSGWVKGEGKGDTAAVCSRQTWSWSLQEIQPDVKRL